MNNEFIPSEQVIVLSDKAVEFFQSANKSTRGVFKDRALQMHYVADLFLHLVETAYPMEDKHEGGCFQGPIHEFITITETSPFSVEQFEKAMENISKIMKDHKPPKAGEF